MNREERIQRWRKNLAMLSDQQVLGGLSHPERCLRLDEMCEDATVFDAEDELAAYQQVILDLCRWALAAPLCDAGFDDDFDASGAWGSVATHDESTPSAKEGDDWEAIPF